MKIDMHQNMNWYFGIPLSLFYFEKKKYLKNQDQISNGKWPFWLRSAYILYLEAQ